MAPISRISIAKSDIVSLFSEREQKIYTKSDIDQILAEMRQFWRLAGNTTVSKFISFLLENTEMREERIEFPYRPAVRYTWGEVPVFTLVQSINPKGYFSHYTAMHMHSLTEQLPTSIFFNQEQPASSGGGKLSQVALNNAFRGKGRVTSNVAPFRNWRIHLPTGGNTGDLGVVEITTSASEQIRVTNIERTLIDATVRPVYSGGVHEVAKAFTRAHDKFSVNKLVATLKELNYTYPYQHAIGFYLQRTGLYNQRQLDLLKPMLTEFDFYLDYGIKQPEYNADWKLFVPKGF